MADIKLKDARLSFPDLWEPTQFKGEGKHRYNATFLIVPGSDNDKAIRAAIAEVAEEKFGKKAPAQLKVWEGNSNKYCYQDGNSVEYDGYADMWFLSCHRGSDQGAPTIVDRDRTRLTVDTGKPYAGCYVNATVSIYAQGGEYPGIRASFSGVQFCRDGDAFSGARPATPDDFDDLGVGADADAMV